MSITQIQSIPSFGEIAVGVRTTVPFRWFEAAVEGIKRRYKSEEEQKTCMVDVTIHGCTIEHTLTPAEEVIALQAKLDAALARIKELEEKEKQQTGSDIAGTPAEPIGTTWGKTDVRAATTEDRAQVFLNAVVQSGFTVRDHMTPLWFFVLQQGMTHAEAEPLLQLPPGAFEAHGRELGLTAPGG